MAPIRIIPMWLTVVNAGNWNGNDLLEWEGMAPIRIIPTWLTVVNAGNWNGNDLLEWEGMATIRIIPTGLASPRCHKCYFGLTLSALSRLFLNFEGALPVSVAK